MIESYDLEKLLKKYGIDASKIINNNENILTYGEYQNIKNVLEYLINECKISPQNIEKCPSVLYFAPQNIKENYEFLKNSEVNFSNIYTTLHILSTDPESLKETYNYVLNNYGVTYLNQTTSILSTNTDRIMQIEKIIDDKNLIISASIAIFSVEEIEKIVKVCRANNIEITSSVFRQPAEEIQKIIDICRANNINITGGVFRQSAEEIQKIINICRANNIEITGNVFRQPAEEIQKIISICRANNIGITGSVFLKPAEEVQKSVDYVKNTYGSAYLTPLIISKNVSHLQEVLPYLESLGVLPYTIKSASILSLTLDEIKLRKEFIEESGASLVLENGRFNSIFGMARKKYQNLAGKKAR